jgi:DNA-binding NtrC family response regulator
VSRFLEQVTEKGSEAKIYSPGAMELLSTVGWPGNVRQLFNLIKQNVALSSGKVMTEQFVKDSLRADSTVLSTMARHVAEPPMRRTEHKPVRESKTRPYVTSPSIVRAHTGASSTVRSAH